MIGDIISPELLKILMEMGRIDCLRLPMVISRAEAHQQCVARLDGHVVLELLDAILAFYLLDRYIDATVTLIAVLPGDPVAVNLSY
jgi:L-fucose mutarotase